MLSVVSHNAKTMTVRAKHLVSSVFAEFALDLIPQFQESYLNSKYKKSSSKFERYVRPPIEAG
jgi:hypothetical protein